MAIYGNFPGVRITTGGGGISAVQVGEQEKLVLFAPGGDGTASVNTPAQINSLSEADKKFGADSLLANAMKVALANGANRDFLYGVQVEQKTVSAEDVTSGADVSSHSSGSKIANVPLVEDTASITFEDDASTPQDHAVTFKFETNQDDTTTDFTALSPPDGEVFINPVTGEWVADDADNYEVRYEYFDYDSAFDGASDVLDEGETGVYSACTESPEVHGSLVETVSSLRSNYQLVQGVAAARPNKTLSNGDPGYDTGTYTDTSDNDNFYLVAPGRQKGSKETIIPAVSGLMAGHAIDDPVYNDALSGLSNLTEKLTGTDGDNLRGADVIPVRQAGSIRVKANRSTGYSSNTDWERDFWRKRIVDRVILITKQVGDDTVGRINDDDTRDDARTVIYNELRDMVRNRLLKPNEDGEVRWMAEVTEDSTNSNQVNIDVGITPMGVVKRIDQTITINT